VESCDENGLALCSLRNKFSQGMELEAVGPDLRPFPFVVGSMTDIEGNTLEEPRTPQMQFYLQLPRPVPAYTILRRAVDLSAK
jgi:putative protease